MPLTFRVEQAISQAQLVPGRLVLLSTCLLVQTQSHRCLLRASGHSGQTGQTPCHAQVRTRARSLIKDGRTLLPERRGDSSSPSGRCLVCWWTPARQARVMRVLSRLHLTTSLPNFQWSGLSRVQSDCQEYFCSPLLPYCSQEGQQWFLPFMTLVAWMGRLHFLA